MRENVGSTELREYWDDVAIHLMPFRYSRFGIFLAPYWKLERRLITGLLLSCLSPGREGERRRLLKTDLWNEGVDSSLGQIYEFVGDKKIPLEVFGIDISPVICQSSKIRMRGEGLAVTCSDVRNLPFKDGTFDAILDVSTLDHIPPVDIASVIGEYSRVLKKDGILILVFDAETFRWLRHLRETFNRLRCKGNSSYRFWWRLSPARVKRQLFEAGFTVLNELPLGILSLSPLFLKVLQTGFASRLVPRLLHSLGRILNFTRTSRYLFPFSSQYVFVTRKQAAPEMSHRQRV